jgi:hypothetical protein
MPNRKLRSLEDGETPWADRANMVIIPWIVPPSRPSVLWHKLATSASQWARISIFRGVAAAAETGKSESGYKIHLDKPRRSF